jgi:hypothetical protein
MKAKPLSGIDLVIDVCIGHKMDRIDLHPLWDQAVKDLKQAGEEGSRNLARLLNEMLQCRSGDIGPALAMADHLPPTKELIAALDAIRSASPVTPGFVDSGRFTPEIAGGGQIGWTDGTAARIKTLAKEALKSLRR